MRVRCRGGGARPTPPPPPPPPFTVQQCVQFTGNDQLRSDSCGDGCFGAARGSRSHQGIDIRLTGRQVIHAPFDATVMRIINAGTNARQAGVMICGTTGTLYENYCMIIFYIRPRTGSYTSGRTFRAGAVLGESTEVNLMYNCPMQNHLHFELFRAARSCNANRRGGCGCEWLDFAWGSDTNGACMEIVDGAAYSCSNHVRRNCGA